MLGMPNMIYLFCLDFDVYGLEGFFAHMYMHADIISRVQLHMYSWTLRHAAG